MRFDFLICSERSGSNLITRILDSHPEVCGPFPTHVIRSFSLQLAFYGDLRLDRNWNTLLEDVVLFLENNQSLWETAFSPEMLRRDVRGRSLADIVRYVYETEARRNGKKRVFVKENHTYSFLPFLLSHFEEAKYVLLVRDPRDMALTWKEAPSGSGQVRTGARQWKTDQGRSIEAYGFLNDVHRIIVVRFEDLVSQPEEEVRRICGFLDLDFSEQMLQFHRKDIVQRNASRLTSWKDLKRPLIRDNFNLYKTRLSEAEVRYVECLCREEMDFFGYTREYAVPGNWEEWERKLPEEDLTRKRTDLESEVHRAFDIARSRVASRRQSLSDGFR